MSQMDKEVHAIKDIITEADSYLNGCIAPARALYKANYRKIPCKIGDSVFAIRNYSGVKKIQKGIVSEMYFIEGMRLCIVVRKISRGEWGKVVFPSYEEARSFLDEE